MEIIFEKAKEKDIFEIEELYNLLNDYLEETINYPGWIKHVYPTIETAEDGLKSNSIFVAKSNGKIVGSVILNNHQEIAYKEGKWTIEAEDKEILVVHTLVVHPNYLSLGIGKRIMGFIKEYAINNGIKTIRLDTSEKNIPASKLYEKCNYKYCGTVDLGLGIPDLVWFKLFELDVRGAFKNQ